MPLIGCFRRDCLCTWTGTSWTGTSLRACGERTRWTRRETTSSWSAVRTTGPSEAPGTTATNSSWTSSSSGACSKPGRTLRRSVRVHWNTSITTLQLIWAKAQFFSDLSLYLLEISLNGSEIQWIQRIQLILINHWGMIWTQYKDPVCHLCVAGTVVAS